MTRRTYIVQTLAASVRDLRPVLTPVPIADAAPDGLLGWLDTVNGQHVSRAWLSDVTRRAWGERVTAATLARRFEQAHLRSPLIYAMAIRAGHVGYALSNGLTIREITDVADAGRKTIYGLLLSHQRQLDVGDLIERARRSDPLWLARAVVRPLIELVPAVAWWYPRVLRRGVA